MKGKYGRRHKRSKIGQPRSDGYRDELGQRVHNAAVEARKNDHDINSMRRVLMTTCAEEDADPVVALDASLSLAAQLVKLPPPGEKKHGWWYYMRRAWRAWRFTKIEVPEPAKEAADDNA